MLRTVHAHRGWTCAFLLSLATAQLVPFGSKAGLLRCVTRFQGVRRFPIAPKPLSILPERILGRFGWGHRRNGLGVLSVAGLTVSWPNQLREYVDGLSQEIAKVTVNAFRGATSVFWLNGTRR
jgi:hypothetical protein